LRAESLHPTLAMYTNVLLQTDECITVNVDLAPNFTN